MSAYGCKLRTFRGEARRRQMRKRRRWNSLGTKFNKDDEHVTSCPKSGSRYLDAISKTTGDFLQKQSGTSALFWKPQGAFRKTTDVEDLDVISETTGGFLQKN